MLKLIIMNLYLSIENYYGYYKRISNHLIEFLEEHLDGLIFSNENGDFTFNNISFYIFQEEDYYYKIITERNEEIIIDESDIISTIKQL